MKTPFYIVLFLLGFTMPLQAQQKWTLQQCIDTAVHNNISLQQSALSEQSQEVSYQQSKWNRVPTVNANGNQGFAFGRSVDPYSNQFVNQTIRTNNFSISGGMTLFNGMQNTNATKQSQLNYQSAHYDVEAAKNDLVLNVLTAYLQLLYAYEQYDNAMLQVNTAEEQLNRTRKLVASGNLAEINVLQMQTSLSSAQYTRVSMNNNVRMAKLTLLQLMNKPMNDNFEIERELPQLDSSYQYLSSAEEIYENALLVHPEIKSYDLKYNSSEIGLRMANGARLPRLTLSGGLTTGYSSARTLSLMSTTTRQVEIGYLTSNPTETVSAMSSTSVITRSDYPFFQQLQDNFAQNVSLSLNVPILNNHTYSANIQRARINIANARLAQEGIRLQLRQQIEQSYTEMKGAEARYQAAEAQYKDAEYTYQTMEKRYQAGVVNVTELLIARNNYLSSNTELLQAKYEYLFKIKVLEFLKNGAVL